MNMKTGMFAIALTGLFAAGNVSAEIITTDNVIENALFSNEGGSRLDGWTLEVGSPQFGARADGYYIRGGANYENNMRISQVVSFEDLNINTSVIDAGFKDLYNDVSLPLLGFGLLPGLFMFAGRRKGRKVV